jgi:hypothetical protein
LRRWRATWPAWRAGSQAQAELRQPETPGPYLPPPLFLPHLPHKLSAQFSLLFQPIRFFLRSGSFFQFLFFPTRTGTSFLHIVVDPHHLDPDPAFHFDPDPDSTFLSDADSDPTFQFDADPDPTTNFFPRFGPFSAPKFDPLRLPPLNFDADPGPLFAQFCRSLCRQCKLTFLASL